MQLTGVCFSNDSSAQSPTTFDLLWTRVLGDSTWRNCPTLHLSPRSSAVSCSIAVRGFSPMISPPPIHVDPLDRGIHLRHDWGVRMDSYRGDIWPVSYDKLGDQHQPVGDWCQKKCHGRSFLYGTTPQTDTWDQVNQHFVKLIKIY